ncbi:MAG: glycerate kinase, partial [Microbacterium sp.]
MHSVVVAVDSFKGSISAGAAAAALADGWREVRPGDELVLRPMADGGEGTLDAFAAAIRGARRMPVTVRGPHGGDVTASWLLLPGGTGVVELASTSGIELLGGDLRPWSADTRGFGQAIGAALDHGVRRLVLGIGSSASTDGGAGMLAALGARFADAAGLPIASGLQGLQHLAAADLSGLRPPPPGGVVVLSDVTSPLCGPRGAAAVFGPQKGLSAADLPRADAALARLAGLIAAVDPEQPGAGAAGGTGFGLLAWGARLVPGAAEVAELIALRAA